MSKYLCIKSYDELADTIFLFVYRTHSVILVNKQGEGHFIERTMKEPINAENIADVSWLNTDISFNLGIQSRL